MLPRSGRSAPGRAMDCLGDSTRKFMQMWINRQTRVEAVENHSPPVPGFVTGARSDPYLLAVMDFRKSARL
jgi:hypothetical protein